MGFWEVTGEGAKLQILNWRQVFRIGFTYIGVILIALFLYRGLNFVGDVIVVKSVVVCIEESGIDPEDGYAIEELLEEPCWYVDISLSIHTILDLAAYAVALAAVIGVAIKGYSDAKSASRYLENKTDKSFVQERKGGDGKLFVQAKPVVPQRKVRPPPGH